jgi:hypothetical protein
MSVVTRLLEFDALVSNCCDGCLLFLETVQ